MIFLGGSLCSFLILSLSMLSTRRVEVEAASSINAFTDTKCKVRPSKAKAQVGPPDGFCQEIQIGNVSSISIASLDDGCLISFYSDRFCSYDATAVYDDDCGVLADKKKKIRSFSVDGCPPGTPGLTSTATAPSSTEEPDPSSTSDSAGASETSATASPSPSPTSAPKNNSAVIGGAVGGTLGFLVIAGIAGFFGWRHYRNSRLPPNLPPGADGYHGENVELEGSSSYYAPVVGMAKGNEQGVKYDPNVTAELRADQAIHHELEGEVPATQMIEKKSVEELPSPPKAPEPDQK